MAMGRRKNRERTRELSVATDALPRTGGHPFYSRLNRELDAHGFEAFVEAQCAPFYAATVGRPSLLPGTYFRLLFIGYFEGIDSERGIAWRAADSLALRGFLGLGLEEPTPEHSTISRTRRLIDLETHRTVFTWVLQVLATVDLVKGHTVGVDATTLEANAALRSIVRRDSGETYQEFLTRLAQASGIETPTRADLARLDRTRPKKGRNADWQHPHDPDARITKMKDGRTHLAHKAEHAVDMETGAVVGVTVQGADQGDTTTVEETLTVAAEELEAVAAVTEGATDVIDEAVMDKGYHSNRTAVDLTALGIRSFIAEPARGRRRWTRQPEAREAVYANRRRIRSPRRPGVAAAAQRAPGTSECAPLRDGRDAPHPPARPHEHSETVARARRRLQSRALHAHDDGDWYAAQPAGARHHRARAPRGALGMAGTAVARDAAVFTPSLRALHPLAADGTAASAPPDQAFNHGLLGFGLSAVRSP